MNGKLISFLCCTTYREAVPEGALEFGHVPAPVSPVEPDPDLGLGQQFGGGLALHVRSDLLVEPDGPAGRGELADAAVHVAVVKAVVVGIDPKIGMLSAERLWPPWTTMNSP